MYRSLQHLKLDSRKRELNCSFVYVAEEGKEACEIHRARG